MNISIHNVYRQWLYFSTPGHLIRRMNVVIVPTSSRIKHVASQPVYEVINSCKKVSVSVIFEFQQTTRVRTLIVATIYLQLIQNRYMFRSFTVLHCSHQHCVQPVASDVEVVGYL